MRQFRRALDDVSVDELHLHGRRYTWSTERTSLTLERIDHVFANVPWLELFPHTIWSRIYRSRTDVAALVYNTLGETEVQVRGF